MNDIDSSLSGSGPSCKGTIFSILGLDILSANEVLAGTLTKEGFSCVAVKSESNRSHLEFVQCASAIGVVSRALEQRILLDVRIGSRDDEVIIRFLRRRFGWYYGFAVLLALIVGICWIKGIGGLLRACDDPSAFSITSLFLGPLGFFLAFWLNHLVAGSSAYGRLMDALRKGFRERGTALEEMQTRARNPVLRDARILVAYICIIAAITIAVSGPIPLKLSDGVNACLLIAMLLTGGIGAALVRVAIVGRRSFGSSYRLAGVLPSLLGSIAMICLFVAILALHGLRLPGPAEWERAIHGLHVPNGQQLLASHHNMSRVDIRFLIYAVAFVSTVASLLGGFLFLTALFAAEKYVRLCRTIQTDVAMPALRSAASGEGYLPMFRSAFICTWLVHVVFWVVGSILITLGGLEALGSPSIDPAEASLGVVAASAYAVSYCMGSSKDMNASLMVVRAAWVSCMLFVWVIWLAPVCYYTVMRRKLFNKLKKAGRCLSLQRMRLQEDVAFLWRHSTADPPTLAVVKSEYCFACAHEFGLWKTTRFIEISSGALDLLSTVEIEATLAHEIAHLLGGHTRTHNFLHRMAQLTLVGSAFAGALEDSFGYEGKADEITVGRMGIQPSSLQNALIKLQIANRIGQEQHDESPESSERAAEQSGFPRWKSWRVVTKSASSIRAWWTLYASDTAITYWHPPVMERVFNLGQCGDENT